MTSRDGLVPVSGTERGHDTRPGEVEAVAEALLNESRKSMFAIPIPLDRASGPGQKQYRREAEVAIAALDAFRAGVSDVSR